MPRELDLDRQILFSVRCHRKNSRKDGSFSALDNCSNRYRRLEGRGLACETEQNLKPRKKPIWR